MATWVAIHVKVNVPENVQPLSSPRYFTPLQRCCGLTFSNSSIHPFFLRWARAAWHHGILHHLRSWLELNEEATVVSLHSPEMATALGEFAERMLDLN